MGEFLSAGDLATTNPFVARYFDEDGTEAYIITEVLTSRSITVAATDDEGHSLSLDVPAIANAVGAKVTVATGSQQSRHLTYTGQVAVTFGFKTFGIAHVGGTWRIHGVKPSAGMAYTLPAVIGVGADRSSTGTAAIEGGRLADPVVFDGGVRLRR